MEAYMWEVKIQWWVQGAFPETCCEEMRTRGHIGSRDICMLACF